MDAKHLCRAHRGDCFSPMLFIHLFKAIEKLNQEQFTFKSVHEITYAVDHNLLFTKTVENERKINLDAKHIIEKNENSI